MHNRLNPFIFLGIGFAAKKDLLILSKSLISDLNSIRFGSDLIELLLRLDIIESKKNANNGAFYFFWLIFLCVISVFAPEAIR